MTTVDSKLCGKCKTAKPITDFHKRTYSNDGLAHYCKECKKVYDAQYSIKNKETKKENDAKNYSKKKLSTLLSDAWLDEFGQPWFDAFTVAWEVP